MTRYISILSVLFLLLVAAVPAMAQSESLSAETMTTPMVDVNGSEQGLDERIDAAFEPISDAVVSVVFFSIEMFDWDVPLVLIWLVAASVFFTFYFGFANIRYFKTAIDLLREPTKTTKRKKKGEISRLQALSTSVSGTVGLGNIAGVAVAISLGGPGAMIWMILMGLFGMSTKLVEISLAVKHRHVNKDGDYSGGPMYYLRDGFDAIGKRKLGLALGAFFSVCCIGGAIGGGNMFQVNQAFKQFISVTGGDASFMADKGALPDSLIANCNLSLSSLFPCA